MNASKNILENQILKQLSIYHAIGEVKLYDMIIKSEAASDKTSLPFQMALSALYRKGIIEIVTDPTDTLSVVRLINIMH
jgi:hypothetical protein